MDIKTTLSEDIADAVRRAAADGLCAMDRMPPVVLTVPPQKEFGDFAANIALQLAGQARRKPREVAAAIIDRLPRRPWLDRAEVAGPGFINFYLRPTWLYDTLADVLRAGTSYGCTAAGGGERVQVEFVSANPTGPLHVGHGRGAAVGSALANLLRAAGYDVSTEYYINDAGNQIDNLAASVNARYLELLGRPVPFPADGYHGADIVATAQRIIKRDGDKYLAMDEEARLRIFRELALAEKQAALKEDLENFGVTYDVWFSERTLHQSGAIAATCRLLQERGDMYEQDGALWLRSTKYGDDKDRVVIRDNGVPTYLAADIAYHRNKFSRGFDRVINLWGADHHGYIARVKAALAALGYDPARLEVMILQMVSLYRGGEMVKMSKRTGQSITLAELIEEVGRDAARFFFIMRSPDSQLDFDLDLAKSHTNENPVYYIQYACARIASLFRQAAEQGVALRPLEQIDLTRLTAECETDIIKKLYEYPEEVSNAARQRAPHHIARYAHELAGLFHTFYNQCRIIGSGEETEQARLALVTATRHVITHALGILGITAPERM